MKRPTRELILWSLPLALLAIGERVLAWRTPDSVACEALAARGFSDCQVQDRHVLWPGLFGCGNEGVGFEAQATNPARRRVNVLVCCGVLLKGCTLRTQARPSADSQRRL